MSNYNNTEFFGTEKTGKILFRLAPPVILAQLIQALYNVVDSYFVGKYAHTGLTALSVIYPVQLLISAFAIGTGVGINTLMARLYGEKKFEEAKKVAGSGTILALTGWCVFAIFSALALGPYIQVSAQSQIVRKEALIYGQIVCICSLGIFLESAWTKILQAKGDMRTPMIAQVTGAIINVILDPILIFGWLGIPAMGVTGAAIATIIGQVIAAVITGVAGYVKPCGLKVVPRHAKQIFRVGIPSILLQAMYTFYIAGLNMILVTFSDAAVTVLGLYYKVQTFFLVPLLGLQTCIVPILSYNYAIRRMDRCKSVMKKAIAISLTVMVIGLLAFEIIPKQLLGIFTKEEDVLDIGVFAFRIIAMSFIPIVFSLMIPVFFQAIGKGVQSIILILLRHIVLFVPVAWLLSFIGLEAVWFTFPITDTVTTLVGIYLYVSFKMCEDRKQ